ncbi:glucosaminidase domain-containing protein [Mammaliicoccus sciuri]|uniref:glucosaminidase domain-containing protein n=1 Tax=Mammaliicoccus sciuri TaxID=1296 RepID=UPI001629BBD5|nr:glucosaminidase domain-containing protein [Mammaliicoccus sciuri]
MAQKPTATQVKNWALKIVRNKTTIDVDKKWGGQCWDLCAYVSLKYWNYFPTGNAIAWSYNKLPSGFIRYRNTTNFVPKPGDFAIWGSGPWNNGVGHCSIVVGPSDKNNFTSVDQNWFTNNWSGSPPSKIKHTYYGVSYFIRPPYRKENTTANNAQKEQNKKEPNKPTTVNPENNESAPPKYKTITTIKYSKYNEENLDIDNIFQRITTGIFRVGDPKGITIRMAKTSRSVQELYNDRDTIPEDELPHFYTDKNRIWSPRHPMYEVPGDKDNVVIEICRDMNDVKTDYYRHELMGLIMGVTMLESYNIPFKVQNLNLTQNIWRSLKEHTGFDIQKDGKATKGELLKLKQALIKFYDKRKEYMDSAPKEIVTKKKIKVSSKSTVSSKKTSSSSSNSSSSSSSTAKKSKVVTNIDTSKFTFAQALNKQMSVNPQINIGNGWYTASRAQTQQYMHSTNVRKSTVQRYQMLNLGKYQGISVSKLNQLLRNKGKLHNQGSAFAKAGKTYNVNEIYLIAHALLETGNGTSNFASGSSGYYNMYGIGAYDYNPNYAITFARNQGWNTVSKAIIGGAKFIRSNYISKGQNTLYRMRWNPKNPGTHQYATDIRWANHQATIIYNYYKKIGSKGMYFQYDRYK